MVNRIYGGAIAPQEPVRSGQQTRQGGDFHAALQQELQTREYTSAAGGGAVSATVNGAHELTALTIRPDVIDPDDAEMLADLVLAAVNAAQKQAADDAEQSMSRVTGGLDLPGLL